MFSLISYVSYNKLSFSQTRIVVIYGVGVLCFQGLDEHLKTANRMLVNDERLGLSLLL